MKPAAWLGIGALILGVGVAVYLALGTGDSPQPDNPVKPVGQEKPADARPENPAGAPLATADKTARSEAPRSTAGTATPSTEGLKGGLEGRVTSTTGEPVVGAKIELTKVPGGNNPFGQSLVQLTRPKDAPKPESYASVSGPDGTFKILAPPGDGWRILATHSEYARYESTNLSMPADSFFTFSFVMKPGVRVYGRVTDNEKNMPLSGAVVVMNDQPPTGGFAASTADRRETATDSSGTFKFENVAPGRHSFTFRAQTYGTKYFPTVMIGDEQTYRQDAVLAPGRSISGRVFDSESHAVPKARVRAHSQGVGGSFGEAITTDLGEFVVTDLEDGRYFLIADAGDLGQGRPMPPELPIAAGTVDVELRLAPRSGIQGTVRDKTTNKAISNFSIEVRRGGAGMRVFPRAAGPFQYRDRRDGSFEVPNVEAQAQGQYVLFVTAEGYAGSYSDPFAVQQGQTTRGIDVMLSTGGSIKGQLLDKKTNQPVSGVSVRTRDNEYRDISGVGLGFLGEFVTNAPQRTADITAVTDAEGRFEIKHVEEGIVQLQITHPRFVTEYQKDLSILNGRVVDLGQVRLSSGSIVKGVVYAAAGGPAPNAQVKLQSSGSPAPGASMSLFSKTVRCDAEGRFTIQNVPAGEYLIHAVGTAANGGASSPFVEMAMGQKTRKPLSVGDSIEVTVEFYLPQQ